MKILYGGLMRKFSYVLVTVCLLATLLAGTGRTALWVGPEIGANFIQNINIDFGNATLHNVRVRPSVIYGITIGYDFVNTGVLAHEWPAWMKYFHFVTDLTYNQMDIASHNVSGSVGNVSATVHLPKLTGYMVAWAFGVLGHYPLAGGKVNPYIGGGPAILWSSLESGQLGAGSSSSTVAALWIEAGVRFGGFVALPNITIDTAYRFRTGSPSYNFNGASLSFTGYSHSVLVRASYHF